MLHHFILRSYATHGSSKSINYGYGGHHGVPGNETADQIAKSAARAIVREMTELMYKKAKPWLLDELEKEQTTDVYIRLVSSTTLSHYI